MQTVLHMLWLTKITGYRVCSQSGISMNRYHCHSLLHSHVHSHCTISTAIWTRLCAFIAPSQPSSCNTDVNMCTSCTISFMPTMGIDNDEAVSQLSLKPQLCVPDSHGQSTQTSHCPQSSSKTNVHENDSTFTVLPQESHMCLSHYAF